MLRLINQLLSPYSVRSGHVVIWLYMTDEQGTQASCRNHWVLNSAFSFCIAERIVFPTFDISLSLDAAGKKGTSVCIAITLWQHLFLVRFLFQHKITTNTPFPSRCAPWFWDVGCLHGGAISSLLFPERLCGSTVSFPLDFDIHPTVVPVGPEFGAFFLFVVFLKSEIFNSGWLGKLWSGQYTKTIWMTVKGLDFGQLVTVPNSPRLRYAEVA